MKIKIEIDCNNEAFEDQYAPELGRILRKLAGDIVEWGGQLEGRALMDANGNKVGTFTVED